MLKRRLQPAIDKSDPEPSQVVPFGAYGGGEFTGHPIGLVVVLGIMLIALVGFPPIRLFFLFAAPIGLAFGLLLWRRQVHTRFRNIVPLGGFGGGLLNGRSVGLVVVFSILLIGLLGTPLVKLFFLLAVPAGSLVAVFLWFGESHRT